MNKEELIEKAKDMNEKSWGGCDIKISLIKKIITCKCKKVHNYPHPKEIDCFEEVVKLARRRGIKKPKKYIPDTYRKNVYAKLQKLVEEEIKSYTHFK